jgi:flagellar protein FlaG
MRVGNEIQEVFETGQKLSPSLSENKTQVRDWIKEEVSLHKNTTVDKQKLETAAAKLNDLMEPLRTNVKFELHDKLDEYYVTIVNQDTDETIREIPPRQLLDMYADMLEFMGILIDEKI